MTSTKKGQQKTNAMIEKNLRALGERQPLLCKFLREYMRTNFKSDERFSIKAEETMQGTWWSGFHDQPFFESNSVPDCFSEDNKPVLILAGVGTPRYLVAVLNKINRRQVVILMESSIKLLLFCMEQIAFFSDKNHLDLYLLINDEESLVDEIVQKAYAHRGFFMGGLFDVLVHPGEIELTGDAYRTILRSYVARINYRMQSIGDSAEDSLLGFRQMALVSPWILCRGKVSSLEKRFKGYSGVVLSAGPSLDKNIHLLKGMEDRIVIVAADTLLNKLSILGIKPHFVCALERGVATYEKYFRPLYEREDPFLLDIVLIAQSVCVPQIVGRWPGRLCVVGKKTITLDREVINDSLGGTVLPSGSSVAHMGMALLDYLGVDKIALIGQDLAFGENGTTHTCQTTWETEKADVLQEKRILVPGALGGTVETTPSWGLFIKTFEEMIPQLSCSVWDCTEGGALIGGTHVSPLSSYLKQCSPMHTQEKVQERLVRFFSDHGSEESVEESALIAQNKLASLHSVFVESVAKIQRGRGLLAQFESLASTSCFRKEDVASFYDLLKDMVDSNPILTYLGQSYLATLLGEQACVDFNKQQDRESWVLSHDEFFRAQERVVYIFTNWLAYMRESMEQISVFKDLKINEPPSFLEEGLIRMRTLLQEAEEKSLGLENAIILDFLYSRADLSSGDCDYIFLWLLGRHLAAESRYYESSAIFQKALSLMEGTQLSPKTAAEFLKDRARSLMGRDLCWIGHPLEALVSLANAFSYASDDKDLPPLLMELLLRRREDQDDQMIKETSMLSRNARASVIEALTKEIALLGAGGDGAKDVLRRYLVEILKEKDVVQDAVEAKASPSECRKDDRES